MTWKDLPILVPLSTAVAVSLAIPTLRIFTPGAKISTSGPKFEKEALISVEASIAPTVIAEGADAGDVLEASWSLFPAATTTVIPARVRAAIAEFNAADLEPPMDRLATARPARLRAVAFVATIDIPCR